MTKMIRKILRWGILLGVFVWSVTNPFMLSLVAAGAIVVLVLYASLLDPYEATIYNDKYDYEEYKW